MTPSVIVGGSYGEALPSGAYGVLVPRSHIATHLGPVALPREEVAAGGSGPLYLRVTDVGGWQMAGQSHMLTGLSWHYHDGAWHQIPNGAHGVSGLIFDRTGALRFATPAVGSQGFRYVDEQNHLVTGDATYHDPAWRIWEWTTHGDITVGQGASHCLLLRGRQRKILSPGEARFVRFNRAGDVCAVTVVQLASHRTLLFRFTTAEIDVLPDDVPVPPPVEPPVPEENHLAEVKVARNEFAGYPASVERGGRITNRAAILINESLGIVEYGLLAKTSGTNWNGYSIDCLMKRTGETWDVLGDAEGAAVPQWARTTPSGMSDPAKWRAPVVDTGGPLPPPEEPPPTSPPYDDTELRARITALEVQMAHVLPLAATTADRLDHLRVKGSTSRTWSHAHEVDLKVEG
jgi:hypothetical protein